MIKLLLNLLLLSITLLSIYFSYLHFNNDFVDICCNSICNITTTEIIETNCLNDTINDVSANCIYDNSSTIFMNYSCSKFRNYSIGYGILFCTGALIGFCVTMKCLLDISC